MVCIFDRRSRHCVEQLLAVQDSGAVDTTDQGSRAAGSNSTIAEAATVARRKESAVLGASSTRVTRS
jgi:hypothetical protein